MCFSVRMTHFTHVAWRHIFHSFSRIECINDTSHLLWIYHSLNQRRTNDKIMPMQNIQRRIVCIALVLLLYDVRSQSAWSRYCLLLFSIIYLANSFRKWMNEFHAMTSVRERMYGPMHMLRLCQQRQFKLFGSMRLMGLNDWHAIWIDNICKSGRGSGSIWIIQSCLRVSRVQNLTLRQWSSWEFRQQKQSEQQQRKCEAQ